VRNEIRAGTRGAYVGVHSVSEPDPPEIRWGGGGRGGSVRYWRQRGLGDPQLRGSHRATGATDAACRQFGDSDDATTETDGEVGCDAAGGDETDTDDTGERDTEVDSAAPTPDGLRYIYRRDRVQDERSGVTFYLRDETGDAKRVCGRHVGEDMSELSERVRIARYCLLWATTLSSL